MKMNELIDVSIDNAEQQLVIQLPNGQRMATDEYLHSINERGEPVIVIMAGRKIGKIKRCDEEPLHVSKIRMLRRAK